jgi:hypothetical protein
MVEKSMRNPDAAGQISHLSAESVVCKKANGAVQNLPFALSNTQAPPLLGRLARHPRSGAKRPIRVCLYGHAIYRMVNLEYDY